MVTLNAESLGQRERRVPIGWWRIAVLDGCFHASPVGASSCAQRERSPGMRTMWVSAQRHRCPPLRLASILWSVIRGASRSPTLRRASSSHRKLTVSVELYDCWDPSLKPERDGAGLKLHEQTATRPIWLLGAQELLREEPEIDPTSNRYWNYIQGSLMKRKKSHRTSKWMSGD